MSVTTARSSDPELRAGAARWLVSAANRPTSSGQTTRSRWTRRCEAKSSAPDWIRGRPGPRSRRSASPNVLWWKVCPLCIQARSSLGWTAKTRTVRATAGAAARSTASATAAAELGQRIDLLRKLEVVLGDPALRVRRQRDGHRVPRDREVGVMVHLLRRRGDPVHEVDRTLEVVELELLAEGGAVPLPALQVREPFADLVILEKCHRVPRAHSQPGPVRNRDAVRPRAGRRRGCGHSRVRLSARGPGAAPR